MQRLLQRDRKELMGVEEIGEGFRAEFDEEPAGDEDAAAEDGRTATSAGASTSGRPPAASSNGSPLAAGALARAPTNEWQPHDIGPQQIGLPINRFLWHVIVCGCGGRVWQGKPAAAAVSPFGTSTASK